MGFLDRIFGAANRADQAVGDAQHAVFRDRRFERAEELAANGNADEAVVTGIRRRLNDSTTLTQVRLEWFDPEPRTGAILWGDDLPLIVRLGATVRVRTDGDQVTLDTAAMASNPAAPSDPGRRSRKVPDPGVDDSALDSRVLSRLKKWTAETAVVESMERATTFGMVTQNWHLVVVRSDGSRATIHGDEVPPYAQWYVLPGAELPVVIDPKDPAKAQGDWPRLAELRSLDGGRWADVAPVGSVAAASLDG